MRPLPTLACVSMIALLAACGQSSDGYYDANGDYQYNAANASAPFAHDVTLRDHAKNANPKNTYDRRGYRDNYGNYVADNEDIGMSVPNSMFPPRGMCRVWFTNRNNVDQPPVESCNRIRTRMPAGAYVIYGG